MIHPPMHKLAKCILAGAALALVSLPATNGGGNPPIEPYVEILSVPDYLFASARHATPIKFAVRNAGNVTISSITVMFFAGFNAQNTINIGNRFVADDGPHQRNGQSATYTCFVPSSFYDGMRLNDYRVNGEGAKFLITVSFTSNLTGKSYTKEAIEWKNVGKRFMDERVDCCDIGESLKDINMKSETQKIWKSGEAKFEIIYSSTNQTPTVIDPSPLGLEGFHRVGDETTAKTVWGNHSVRSIARLIDDGDAVGGVGDGNQYKARIYGVRLGGYMFFSYRGKEHDVLEPGEKAMDLTKETGYFDWKVFEDVQNFVSCKSDTALPLQAGAGLVGGLTGVLWALAPSQPWLALFGTASSIAGLYAAADLDNVNASQSVIYRCYQSISRETDHEGICVREHMAVAAGPLESKTTRDNCASAGRGCRVGDQYNLFVEIEVVVTAEAFIMSRSESTAEAALTVGSLNDFETMEVISF